MSPDAGGAAAALPVPRDDASPPRPAFPPAREDFAAFRALEPGTSDLVVLRPGARGLVLERREGVELVPWEDVRGLLLSRTEAGRATVATVRVERSSGPSIDLADALAPGADGLPLTLGPGCGPLLRMERCRLLAALIASGAGLAPQTTRAFGRGPRAVPVPDLALRPSALPRWIPRPLLVLVMMAGSVLALSLVVRLDVAIAVAITAGVGLHEMGHMVAMALLRLRVRGVLIVPLLGGATVLEHAFSTRWDEARVVLAGPATGLPLAAAFALLLHLDPFGPAIASGLSAALAWSLFVNLFNLLPLQPLDGGRVMSCLVAALPPVPGALLTVAPILLAAGGVLMILDDPIWIPAAVFLAVSFALTRTSLRRDAVNAWMRRLPQPLAAVRASLRDVTFGLSGRAREDIDGGVPPTPLDASQTLRVLLVWFAEAIALAFAGILCIRAFPGILGAFEMAR